MSDVTLEKVLELAKQLSLEEQAMLIKRLNIDTTRRGSITLAEIEAEQARRVAAGEFDNVESLYGKYARPGLDLSFEDIEAAIHEHN